MNGRQKVRIKKLKIPKLFKQLMMFNKNLEDHVPTKRRKVLIVFNYMIAGMESNKTLSPAAPTLFLRDRKRYILSQSYSKVPKTTTLNTKHYFIMKVPNKRKPQEIAWNHSSNIEFKNFMKLYKDCTKKPFSFLVNHTTLQSDNPLRFRTNLL